MPERRHGIATLSHQATQRIHEALEEATHTYQGVHTLGRAGVATAYSASALTSPNT